MDRRVLAVAVGLALALAIVGPQADLRALIVSASSWQHGAGFYVPVVGVWPNANLPHTTLLFVVLASVPWIVARILWALLQVVALVAVGRALSPRQWCGAAASSATFIHFAVGQMMGTLAWLLERPGGAGLVVAVKPMLWPLLLERKTWTRANAVGLVVPWLIGLSVCGLDAYRAWWAQATAIQIGIGDLSLRSLWAPDWWVLATIVLGVSLWHRERAVLLPAALLASPLAWPYYAVLLVPQLATCGVVGWIGWALVAIPQGVLPLGAVGLLLLWAERLSWASAFASVRDGSARLRRARLATHRSSGL